MRKRNTTICTNGWYMMVRSRLSSFSFLFYSVRSFRSFEYIELSFDSQIDAYASINVPWLCVSTTENRLPNDVTARHGTA